MNFKSSRLPSSSKDVEWYWERCVRENIDFSRVTIFFVIIGITLILSGCGINSIKKETNTEESTYSQFKAKIKNSDNIARQDVAYKGDTISYGILNEEGYVESEIYNYSMGEDFEKFIDIGNFIDSDMKYKLLIFNNYKQIDFQIEEESVRSYDVIIEKGKDLQIPLKITSLNEGLNDIIIIIVVDPKSDLSEEECQYNPYASILYLRRNIYVENNTIPSYEITELDVEEKSLLDVSIHKNIETSNEIFSSHSAKKK